MKVVHSNLSSKTESAEIMGPAPERTGPRKKKGAAGSRRLLFVCREPALVDVFDFDLFPAEDTLGKGSFHKGIKFPIKHILW
jgi:hypothetical protein